MQDDRKSTPKDGVKADEGRKPETPPAAGRAKEIGGRGGLDPTRFGDWEKNGRCIDF